MSDPQSMSHINPMTFIPHDIHTAFRQPNSSPLTKTNGSFSSSDRDPAMNRIRSPGPGRTYTITVSSTDAHDNTAMATTKVSVPRSNN